MIVARIGCDAPGCMRHFHATEAAEGARLQNGFNIALGTVILSGTWAARQDGNQVRVFCADHAQYAK